MITNGLPPVHPGEILHEILEDLSLTNSNLAQAIGVSHLRVSHLIEGAEPVTTELALRLSRAFGQTPQYWLNLQTSDDPKIAQTEWQESLLKVQEISH